MKINRIKCIANEIVRKANVFLSKVYVRCKVRGTNIFGVNVMPEKQWI